MNTPLQLDVLQFVLAFPQCEHTFTVGSLTVCFGFHSGGGNTPLQLDVLQFVLAFPQCEHTFTVGSLSLFWLLLGCCEHTFTVGSLTVCFCFCSGRVNTPLQLDLLQFVLAFVQCEHTFTVKSLSLFWLPLGWCEHTFTVGSLTVCFGCRSA